MERNALQGAPGTVARGLKAEPSFFQSFPRRRLKKIERLPDPNLFSRTKICGEGKGANDYTSDPESSKREARSSQLFSCVFDPAPSAACHFCCCLELVASTQEQDSNN